MSLTLRSLCFFLLTLRGINQTSVYEWHKENSLISPLWKTVFALLELLKIFFSECLRVTHWSFCFSKSMSAANTLSMLLILLLLLKRHEQSECHSLCFFAFFSFLIILIILIILDTLKCKPSKAFQPYKWTFA